MKTIQLMLHFGKIYGHAVGTCFMHVRLEKEIHSTHDAFWGDLWTCCRDLLHACPLRKGNPFNL